MTFILMLMIFVAFGQSQDANSESEEVFKDQAASLLTPKEQQSYDYYNGLYLKSKKQMGTGMFLAVFGMGVGYVGYKLLDNNTYNGKVVGSESAAGIGSIMFIGGALMFNVGAPICIAGAVKRKKNKQEMEKIQPSKLTLYYGMTENGMALVLKF